MFLTCSSNGTGNTNGLIVGRGKPYIFSIGNQFNLGEFFSDEAQGTINRIIINHKNLAGTQFRGIKYRV
jgi:hypothetical protein